MRLRIAGGRTRFLVVVSGLTLLLAFPAVAASVPDPARSATSSAPAAVPVPAAATPTSAAVAPLTVAEPEPPRPAPRVNHTRAAVDAAEGAAATSTQLGVAVLDRDTGEVSLGERGSEPFFAASLAKVVVAVDMMDRRRLQGLTITENDIDLLHRALGPSDDNAMNALWTRFDGAGAAGRVAGRLGLAGTTDPDDPSQWGEMSVPAADIVQLWHHILDEMPVADRDLLMSAMAEAPTTAGDGFDQGFGLLSEAVDGPGGPGAVAKQGWLCCFSGRYYLHTTGAVGSDKRYLVALLTRVPRGGGWEAARQEVTRIATATVQALG